MNYVTASESTFLERDTKSIAVIILAFNRKRFLLRAIKSVLEQNISKSTIDIVIVKNFNDVTIDNFIHDHHIKNIYTDDESLGGKILLGLDNTTSEIICFLEDDDFFVRDKILYVQKIFEENDNIVFYHNSMLPVNTNGDVISKWYRQETRPTYANAACSVTELKRVIHFGAHNLSSISIKREVLNKYRMLLNNITFAIDYIIVLIALDSQGMVVSDFKKLTYYTVHDSASNPSGKDYESLRSEKGEVALGALISMETCRSRFVHSELFNFVDLMVLRFNILSKLYRTSDRQLDIIKYLRLYRFAFNRIDYLLSLVLYLASFAPSRLIAKFIWIFR